jgi:hypothetical protein
MTGAYDNKSRHLQWLNDRHWDREQEQAVIRMEAPNGVAERLRFVR